MNITDRALLGAGVIAAFIFFSNPSKTLNSGLTNDDIQSIIVTTEGAFDDAEQSILGGDKPVPPDDDEPTGPDPDPAKCICKGTGKIVQGDGHVSACPYHGQKDLPVECDDKPITTKQSVQKRRGLFGGRLFGR